MFKFNSVFRFVCLVVLLLCCVAPVLGQDGGASESPPPIVVQSDWASGGVVILAGVVIVVAGFIAYKAVEVAGLSLPPGSAETLQRAYESGRSNAQKTQNTYDDMAFYLAQPVVQNFINEIRAKEGKPPLATKPDLPAEGDKG